MKDIQEYAQAVLVGSSLMGAEAEILKKMLLFAGKRKREEGSAQVPKPQVTGQQAAGQGMRKRVYLIAVDGGIAFLEANGIRPDYWIGDLDSLPEGEYTTLTEVEGRKVPVRKDETDMELAMAYAYEEGYREMLIYGGLGGSRMSHTYANTALMLQYAKKGCMCKMFGDGVSIEVLYNGVKTYSSAFKGQVSVFALGGTAKDVCIEGLSYEYEGDLKEDEPLGVSNRFIGENASIGVGDGGLLIVYEKI